MRAPGRPRAPGAQSVPILRRPQSSRARRMETRVRGTMTQATDAPSFGRARPTQESGTARPSPTAGG
eukprot:2764056-Lingulodinium_polyedra.AAC.1